MWETIFPSIQLTHGFSKKKSALLNILHPEMKPKADAKVTNLKTNQTFKVYSVFYFKT